MAFEHPVDQPITEIVVVWDNHEMCVEGLRWVVGRAGVTLIEACSKAGEHSYIPYIRVWRGGEAVAEYCQHGLRAVHFGPKPTDDRPGGFDGPTAAD